MILSVHIPKTAGTSFRAEVMAGKFGRHLLDYDDKLYSTYPRDIVRRYKRRRDVRIHRALLNEQYDIIHGHFCATKYLNLFPSARLITFLRDPLSVTISLYDHWRTEPKENFVGHSWYERTIARGVSILEFARSSKMRSYYDRILGGVPLSRFFFIGIVERYQESLDALGRLLGVSLHEHQLNVRSPELQTSITAEEREQIMAANNRNYSLYREALRVQSLLVARAQKI